MHPLAAHYVYSQWRKKNLPVASLHLRPELVDMSKAQDFRSLIADLAGDFHHLTVIGPTRFAWQAQDLNPAGVVGNARDADAARGAQLIEHAATQFAALLGDVDRFPLNHCMKARWSGRS